MSLSDQSPVVSISISATPCVSASQMGFGEHSINRMIVRISEFCLFKNVRVVFGHDWREDGVMRSVAQAATRAISGGHWDHRARMINLVPKPALSPLAKEAASQLDGVLEVLTLADHLQQKGIAAADNLSKDEASNGPTKDDKTLWTLRHELTKMLDPGARICLGGKEAGYAGCYSGIAEEAYFALQAKKPLYLIGGFGGTTSHVFTALTDPQKAADLETLKPKRDLTSETIQQYQLPPNGLAEAFAKIGLQGLSELNGLTPEENMQLAEATDLEFALRLIWKGLFSAPSTRALLTP